MRTGETPVPCSEGAPSSQSLVTMTINIKAIVVIIYFIHGSFEAHAINGSLKSQVFFNSIFECISFDGDAMKVRPLFSEKEKHLFVQ